MECSILSKHFVLCDDTEEIFTRFVSLEETEVKLVVLETEETKDVLIETVIGEAGADD